MLQFNKEEKEQLKYPESQKGLKDNDFVLTKSAQGQPGMTRKKEEDGYVIYETVSFKEKRLYVYRQIDNTAPLKKIEIKVSKKMLSDYKRLLEVFEKVDYNTLVDVFK